MMRPVRGLLVGILGLLLACSDQAVGHSGYLRRTGSAAERLGLPPGAPGGPPVVLAAHRRATPNEGETVQKPQTEDTSSGLFIYTMSSLGGMLLLMGLVC